VRTRHLQLVTPKHSDITSEKSGASSPFGPVNPASTTLLAQEIHRANQDRQLMELLSSLENAVENLQFKSFTVYDTLNTVIENLRASLSSSIINTAGIRICDECGDDEVAEDQSKCLDCLESVLD
jgi:hypothetical protein